jgi:hypothetical protein
VYQWHATRRQALVEQAWVQCGLLVHQTIVWVKARGVLTRSHYLWSHEPCFYGWVEGNPPKLKPPASERTVWHVDQVGEQSGYHPTQKPVELFLRPIEFHTPTWRHRLRAVLGIGYTADRCRTNGADLLVDGAGTAVRRRRPCEVGELLWAEGDAGVNEPTFAPRSTCSRSEHHGSTPPSTALRRSTSSRGCATSSAGARLQDNHDDFH